MSSGAERHDTLPIFTIFYYLFTYYLFTYYLIIYYLLSIILLFITYLPIIYCHLYNLLLTHYLLSSIFLQHPNNSLPQQLSSLLTNLLKSLPLFRLKPSQQPISKSRGKRNSFHRIPNNYAEHQTTCRNPYHNLTSFNSAKNLSTTALYLL